MPVELAGGLIDQRLGFAQKFDFHSGTQPVDVMLGVKRQVLKCRPAMSGAKKMAGEHAAWYQRTG